MTSSSTPPPDAALDSLQQLQRDWDGLARKDAMWAVLTGPLGAERAWDPDAFFQTGVHEVGAMLGRLSAAGVTPAPGRALDFGCGPGRLSAGARPGISRGSTASTSPPTMIEQARTLNRRGDGLRLPPQHGRRPEAVSRPHVRLHLLVHHPPAHGASAQPRLHRRVLPCGAARRHRRVPDPLARRRGRAGAHTPRGTASCRRPAARRSPRRRRCGAPRGRCSSCG